MSATMTSARPGVALLVSATIAVAFAARAEVVGVNGAPLNGVPGESERAGIAYVRPASAAGVRP